MLLIRLIILSLLLLYDSVGSLEIKIGGLFDCDVNETQKMFKYAVETINNARDSDFNLKLEPQMAEVPYGNEFAVSKKLCRHLKMGVAAIIGPSSPSSAVHAMNICDAKEIPFIDLRWDAATQPPVINVHPHPETIAQIFVDIIRSWEWKGFTILYESAPWLPRVAKLLMQSDPKGHTITVRKINLGLTSNNYRSILRRVKLSDDIHIVIDCSIEALPEVLKQAQQVGLMTDFHQFLIMTLDMHTIDLEPYQYSGTNITSIRIINPENEQIQQLENYISEMETERGEEMLEGLTATNMRLQTALIYDAVLLIVEAFRQLDIDQIKPKKLNCNNYTTWENGNSITNFMRNSYINGLTGPLRFDNRGLRTNFGVDIIELTSSGISKVGTWNVTEGLNITRQYESAENAIDASLLRNKSFIVLTALSPPYGMLKDSAQLLTGNDRFEGFGIDLIHELSVILGFNYTFHLQEDGVYGSFNNATQQWTGMIKELLEHRADLAITDLTITAERESGVDFTMPFMNLGISILFRKPMKEQPSTFSFMSPFSTEVWIYLGAAYLGVSLCLFILGRISPSEWDNPYPCIEEPTELENQFSFRNSLWFTIGALLQQGSEIAPKAPSTRAVAAIWWFFTLIMVSSYTANLAAFLTIKSDLWLIKSAEDLKDCAESEKTCPVTFGAKRDGSTINFFKEAEHGTYKNMYTYMSNHPEYLTADNSQGVNWATTQNYAFLMESSSIEYIIERNCEVTQIGSKLDDKGYGIAMRKNSPYRSALSEAVLQLQERGKLTAMKTKWWKEKKGGGSCSDTSDEGGSVALEMANLEGVFYVLIVGSVISVFINITELIFDVKARSKEFKKKSSGGGGSEHLGMQNMFGVFLVLSVGSLLASLFGILEWIIIIYSRARTEKVPFKEELIEELKFVANCGANTKTVRHRKSESVQSRRSISSDHSNRSKESYDKMQSLKYLDNPNKV